MNPTKKKCTVRTIYVSKATLALIDRARKRAGLSRSKWARKALLHAAINGLP